jgi:hypothetical protein
MNETIGDDHPTYEDSVNLTLAEREVHKDNLERLMLENLQLRHRLACIKDDIEIIDRHISSYKKCRKWFKQPSLNKDGTIYADEAIHNLTNIEIACDLSDEAVDEWGSDLAEEYRKHMESAGEYSSKYKAIK